MYKTRMKLLSNIVGRRRGFKTSSNFFKIVQFNLSDIGEGIKEVTVRDWFVKVGDRVKQFDDVCSVESDKAAVNITSRYDGIVAKLYYGEGDIALVGRPLVDIDTEEDIRQETPPPAISSEGAESNPSNTFELESEEAGDLAIQLKNKSLATPAVRRIAQEYNVSLGQIDGTGKGGRIMKEDILKYLNKNEEKRPISSTPSKEKTSKDGSGDIDVPIVGIKKAMAKAMIQAHAIPTFGYSDELNVDKLVLLRKDINAQYEKDGIKLTYTPFFIKALSLALEHFPEMNAHVDANCENMTVMKSHNVGIGVDTTNGLLVPNIKGVQKMSLLQINAALNELVRKSKERSLTVEDLTGGTITISNIGTIGGTYVRPIIHVPEVAIVGVGKFRKLPLYNKENEVVPTQVCNASWTADHRVIDGATLARFCELWKHYIENPLQLILKS